MTIQCTVNQPEAIRRGFNAASTVKLEVDIATLEKPHRELIAEKFDAGVLRLTIPQPDMAGLLETLNKEIAGRAAQAENTALEEKEFAEKWAAYCELLKADPDSFIERIGYGIRPKNTPYKYQADYPKLMPPDVRSAWDAAVERAIAKDKAATEARDAKETLERQAKEAEKVRSAAALKAQIDVFVTKAGGTLAARHTDGYTTKEEIANLIRDEERTRLGVSYTGDSDDWNHDDSDLYEGPLTDEQYVALQEFKAKCPPGFKHKLYDIHDHQGDEYGEKDKDTKVNRLLVAEYTWKLGEVNVTADAEIGALPDEPAE